METTSPRNVLLPDLVFEKGEFSWKRNIDFFINGALFFGPALHFWYCKLLPRVQSVLFPTSTKTVRVLGSMMIDQLVFAPVLLTVFYPVNQMIIERDVRAFGKGVKVWR